MPFKPYFGERSGSYVLCDKLIDVKEDKIREIKVNDFFLLLCAFLSITLSCVHKQFFDVQKKKKNV